MILAFLPVSTATLESKLGTSDIEAKLITVEIVTGVGVMTVITASKHPENTFKIIEYSVATTVTSKSVDMFWTCPVFDEYLWTEKRCLRKLRCILKGCFSAFPRAINH